MQVGCCHLESLGCSSGRYGCSLGKKVIKMDLQENRLDWLDQNEELVSQSCNQGRWDCIQVTWDFVQEMMACSLVMMGCILEVQQERRPMHQHKEKTKTGHLCWGIDGDFGLISNLETSCPLDKEYQTVEIECVSSLNPDLPKICR